MTVSSPALVADMAAVTHRIFTDPRGSLVPVEVARAVPFPIARIFWVFDVPNGHLRGGHAHKLCSQYLLCLRGTLEVVIDDGEASSTIPMGPGTGLLIPPGIWASERYLTPDTALLVLCSHAYDAADYVDDIEELRRLRAEQRGEPR